MRKRKGTKENATTRKQPAEGMDRDQLTEGVLLALARCGCHPIVQLARFALGDVVGLGMMTEEQFAEEAIYDPDGILLQESGKSQALKILPAKVRFEANKELAGYVWAKAKPMDILPKDGENNNGPPPVQFYLPDNGRTDLALPAPESDTAADAEGKDAEVIDVPWQ